MTESSVHIRSPLGERETTGEYLCSDLDGTILVGDSFWESFLALVGVHPWYVCFVPFWLLRGKAALKHEISRRVRLDVSTLPVREELIRLLASGEASREKTDSGDWRGCKYSKCRGRASRVFRWGACE